MILTFINKTKNDNLKLFNKKNKYLKQTCKCVLIFMVSLTRLYLVTYRLIDFIMSLAIIEFSPISFAASSPALP